jgi:TPR repeat protein
MKQLLETISQKWQFRYFVVGAGLILMVYAGVMPVHSTGSKDIMTPALLSQHSSSDGTSFGPVSVSGSDALSQRATDAGALRGGWSGENKNVVEQLSVAVEPVRGSRLPRDFSDSVRALRTAAEAGDPTAEFLLGHAYESGLGVTKDVTETARWYGRAVVPQPPTTPGTAAATPMNFAQAFELYRRAAEAGNGQAELYMGLEYDMGTDVPRNVEKAATWYRKAAAQGSASAENNLGVLYHEGDGLPKDGMEAVNWFSRAAARGSATAEYCLGRMYFEGDGVVSESGHAGKQFRAGNDELDVCDRTWCSGKHVDCLYVDQSGRSEGRPGTRDAAAVGADHFQAGIGGRAERDARLADEALAGELVGRLWWVLGGAGCGPAPGPMRLWGCLRSLQWPEEYKMRHVRH